MTLRNLIGAALAAFTLASCETTSPDEASAAPPVSAMTFADLELLVGDVAPAVGWSPPPGRPVLSGRRYFDPTPAEKVRVPRGNRQVDVYWNTLSQPAIFDLLTLTDEQTVVERISDSGQATLMGSSANLARGRYRVSYYYYRFHRIPCRYGVVGEGGVAAGVGMRVTAEVVTTKAGVNVAGLMPLAAEAKAERARGTLRVETFGISSGTSALAPYLSGSKPLTPESVQEAVESFGIIRAIYETKTVRLTPHSLFIDAPDQVQCLAAINGQLPTV